jgi:hypothetical protein
MDNVIPIHKKARDGRRILPDGSIVDLQEYAKQPDQRMVQLNLPTALVERIDELAKRDLFEPQQLVAVEACACRRGRARRFVRSVGPLKPNPGVRFLVRMLGLRRCSAAR